MTHISNHHGHIPRSLVRFVGHGDDFWRNFRFILKVAIHYGIYTRVDFGSNPEPYCGIKITDTPY